MTDDDSTTKLKQIAVDNYNENRIPTRTPAMTVELARVLWFSGSNGNFKGVVEFTVVHGLRYEISYNRRRGEAYVDVYKKFSNVKMSDV